MCPGSGLDLDAWPSVPYACGHDAGMAMSDSGPASLAVPETAAGTEDLGNGGDAPGSPDARAGWPYWLAAAVFVVGLVATGVLVWISASTYTNNENRLINL